MDKEAKKVLLIIGGVLLVVAVLFYFMWSQENKPSQLDGFAKCLTDKGAKFYGAFWCPHCQATKKLFGSAAKSLPYIECSTPDGKAALQICTDADIKGYPTWVFADGSRQEGEMSLQALADKTSCTLP